MSKSVWALSAAVLLSGCIASAPVEQAPSLPSPVELPPPADAPASGVEAPAPVEEAPAPTPPEAEKPAQSETGKYRVSVASEKSAADATKWVKKLEADGLRVQAEPVDIKGATWQRIVLPGYASGKDARAMVTYLDQALGIKGAWVIPNKPAKPKVAPAAPAPAATAEPAAAPAVPAPAPAEPAPPATKAPEAEHPQN